MSLSTLFANIGHILVNRLFAPLHRSWLWLREWALVLKPCRFSLLMVAAVLLFLIGTPQGQDVLRALAARASGHHDEWQRVFFFASALAWSVFAWYWARVMLYLEFPNVPKNLARLRTFRTWVPRLIGFVAVLGLAFAFYRASLGYPDDSGNQVPGLLRGYALWCLIGAFVFLALVSLRRKLSKAAYAQLKSAPMAGLLKLPPSEQEKYGVLAFGQLQPATRWLLFAALAGAATLFLLFVFALQRSAPLIGSAGILLLAASGWIAVGSVLDIIGMRLRFPVFIAVLLLGALFSRWNDNHAVRLLDEAPKTWGERDNVTRALQSWLDRQLLRPTGAQGEYPLFVVSAEGGGIRAAYWTATVLGEIQKTNPCFADQLFSLSGVSGGSLGAGVFTALLAEQKTSQGAFRCGQVVSDEAGLDVQRKAQDILGEDFLSPVVAAMLYPDLVQRVWPWPVARFDRARALEHAWEQAWRKHMPGSNRFAQAFDQPWRDRQDVWMPSLFLNTTWVETGQRLLVSNLRVAPAKPGDDLEFNDVADLHRFYAERALPFSTAIHLSARFSYVSPAGALVKNDKLYGRAVDGGYFENSGATTTIEILKALNQLSRPGNVWEKVKPVVIHISNEPVDARFTDIRLDSDTKNPHTKPTAWLAELLSPPTTLLNTRDARGVYARETLKWHVGKSSFLHFGLCQKARQVNIPLGWALSPVVRNQMDRQLSGEACPPFDNPGNLKEINRLLDARHPRNNRRGPVATARAAYSVAAH